MRRHWLSALLIGLWLILIVPYAGQMANAAGALGHGQWLWLAAAVGVLIVWQLAQAAQFQLAFRLVGVSQTLAAWLPVVMANNCLNVIAPSVSASSFALFTADARRRQWPAARVVPGILLFSVLEYAALAVWAACGAFLLSGRHALNWLLLAPTLLAVSVALGLAGLLGLGLRSAPRLTRLVHWLTGRINRASVRWLRRELLPPDRMRQWLMDLEDGWAELGHSSWTVRALALGVALSAKAVLLAVLWFVGLALRVPLSAGDLVAAMSAAALFTVFSPTPQGIGFAEGALALTLTSLGVPWEQAWVAGLAYRALTLWLPVLGGLGWLQWWGRGWAAALWR